MYLNRLVFTINILLLHSSVYGDVTKDGTVGTVVTPSSFETGRFDISHGRQEGINLFHSFEKFGLNFNEHAVFMADGVPEPANVQNILARVTGGDLSKINGKISNARDFTNPNFNLYLINPYGILFGEGASLDVSGSFHATTADYIRLGNRDHFYYASLSKNSTFSSAPPSAFGFLGKPATTITVENTLLNVSEGQTLSIIGGDINIKKAGLVAPSGRVNLASVASAGEVIPEPNLKMVPGSLSKGTIEISGYSLGDTTEKSNSIDVSGNGGQIFIRAGRFFTNDAVIRADGRICCGGNKDSLIDIDISEDMHLKDSTKIVANNYGEGQGTAIKVAANTLEISGVDKDELGGFLAKQLGDFSEDKSQYTPQRLSQLYPQMGGTKGASDFLDKARSLVGPPNEDGPPPVSFEQVMQKFTKQELANNYRKNFFVSVFNLISVSNRSDSKSAGGGKIQIDVQNLQMDTGMIEAYTVGGGKAGDITVNAKNVSLTGLSGINAASFYNPSENGVSLRNGGGTGDGGSVIINAKQNLSVSDYSYISTAVDEGTTGKGGNLTLNTSRLTLDKVGKINSYSDGKGDAGNINITADNAFLSDKSLITTEATQASGGNIYLQVRDQLHLFNSNITAEAKGTRSQDNGGNITIKGNPGKLNVFSLIDSKLLAQANRGHGGVIDLYADKFTISNSQIDVSSRGGFNGSLFINSFRLQETVLPQLRLLGGERLLGNRCASFFSKENQSRFIITARDILPRCPEDLRTPTIRLGR